jgi:membrane protein implicated in regulation of membrane protease activity
MAEVSEQKFLRIVVGTILIVLGVFLWVQNKYGWESPWTLWAALGVLYTVVSARIWNANTRIDKLEKPDQKIEDRSTLS